MREMLFRGKRKDNGEWVQGDSLIHSMYKKGDVCIGVIEGLEIYGVNPETIGQYTGLTDKNGTKIFEGDILKGMGGLHRVYFDTSLACFEWAKINGNWKESFSGFADEYEVIGNINDNPELLKECDGE